MTGLVPFSMDAWQSPDPTGSVLERGCYSSNARGILFGIFSIIAVRGSNSPHQSRDPPQPLWRPGDPVGRCFRDATPVL